MFWNNNSKELKTLREMIEFNVRTIDNIDCDKHELWMEVKKIKSELELLKTESAILRGQFNRKLKGLSTEEVQTTSKQETGQVFLTPDAKPLNI